MEASETYWYFIASFSVYGILIALSLYVTWLHYDKGGMEAPDRKGSIHLHLIHYSMFVSMICYTLGYLMAFALRISELAPGFTTPCYSYMVTAGFLIITAKLSMYTVFGARVFVAFRKSVYAYSKHLAHVIYSVIFVSWLCLSVWLALSGIANHTPIGRTSLGKKVDRYNDDDANASGDDDSERRRNRRSIAICTFEYDPLWQTCTVLVDLSFTIVLLVLFVRPLRKLFKQMQEASPNQYELEMSRAHSLTQRTAGVKGASTPSLKYPRKSSRAILYEKQRSATVTGSTREDRANSIRNYLRTKSAQSWLRGSSDPETPATAASPSTQGSSSSEDDHHRHSDRRRRTRGNSSAGDITDVEEDEMEAVKGRHWVHTDEHLGHGFISPMATPLASPGASPNSSTLSPTGFGVTPLPNDGTPKTLGLTVRAYAGSATPSAADSDSDEYNPGSRSGGKLTGFGSRDNSPNMLGKNLPFKKRKSDSYQKMTPLAKPEESDTDIEGDLDGDFKLSKSAEARASPKKSWASAVMTVPETQPVDKQLLHSASYDETTEVVVSSGASEAGSPIETKSAEKTSEKKPSDADDTGDAAGVANEEDDGRGAADKSEDEQNTSAKKEPSERRVQISEIVVEAGGSSGEEADNEDDSSEDDSDAMANKLDDGYETDREERTTTTTKKKRVRFMHQDSHDMVGGTPAGDIAGDEEAEKYDQFVEMPQDIRASIKAGRMKCDSESRGSVDAPPNIRQRGSVSQRYRRASSDGHNNHHRGSVDRHSQGSSDKRDLSRQPSATVSATTAYDMGVSKREKHKRHQSVELHLRKQREEAKALANAAVNAAEIKDIELQMLPLKYTVTSVAAILSTMMSNIIIGFTGMAFFFYIDGLINIMCLLLMTKQWNNEHWYICGPMIWCVSHWSCFFDDYHRIRLHKLLQYYVDLRDAQSKPDHELSLNSSRNQTKSGGSSDNNKKKFGSK